MWKFEVQSPIEIEGQQRRKWCWLAVSRMMIDHYNRTHLTMDHSIPTQVDVVKAIKSDILDIEGGIDECLEALSHFQANFYEYEKFTPVLHEDILSDNTARQYLNNGDVIMIGRYPPENSESTAGHVYLIAGYTAVFEDAIIQYTYYIYDPWPEIEYSPWEEQIAHDGQQHEWSYLQICDGVTHSTGEAEKKIWRWSITL